MLDGFSKTKIKSFGLITTICLSILIFICLFLVGFDYKEVNQNWTSRGGWRHLAIVQVTTVVVAFVVIVLGFLSFTLFSELKIVTGIFTGLNSLSILFTLSISIFALVAGSVGDFENYIGCNTQYKRILRYWGSLDHYLIKVDREFCGTECPCYINDYAVNIFRSDPLTTKITELWETCPNDKKFNYQTACSEHTQLKVFNEYVKVLNSTLNGEIKDFNHKNFASYWENIENRFECTGWCTTSYQETGSGLKSMVKYLFSDINKGIVKHRGCLKQVLNWLPRVMLAYGSLTLIASLLQVISFILGLVLLLRKEENGESNVKINADDNNSNVNDNKKYHDEKKQSEHNELNLPNI